MLRNGSNIPLSVISYTDNINICAALIERFDYKHSNYWHDKIAILYIYIYMSYTLYHKWLVLPQNIMKIILKKKCPIFVYNSWYSIKYLRTTLDTDNVTFMILYHSVYRSLLQNMFNDRNVKSKLIKCEYFQSVL